jgi:hypothetical protein
MMMRESSERKGLSLGNHRFTVLDGDRRFKRIDWGPATLPPCQAHLIDSHVVCDEPGEFDSPTIQGPWADLCYKHAERFAPKGSTSGYHRIQVR